MAEVPVAPVVVVVGVVVVASVLDPPKVPYELDPVPDVEPYDP